MIDRRHFIVVSATSLLAGRAVLAQQRGRAATVGLLDHGAAVARQPLWNVFRQQLRELGYVEQQTVVLEGRSAEGQTERLPALAAELVELKVDVIVTGGINAALAGHAATSSIPIVMATGSDPIRLGIVRSLAHPGGNVTGITTLTEELTGKRVQLLRELIPTLSRLAILTDRGNPVTEFQAEDTKATAQGLGLSAQVFSVGGAEDFEAAFTAASREDAQGMIVTGGGGLFGERQRMADLATKHRLPTFFPQKEYVEAGGLMAYGANLAEGFRRAALYVDKILKGAKPADLPIEQPTKFELVVNLKTARALGISIPTTMLARADEVIE